MLAGACVFEWWTDSVQDCMLAGLVNLNGGPIVSETVCWLGL